MKNLIVVSLFLALSGCSTLSHLIPPDQELAMKTVPSEAFNELKELPKPKGRIPVSVYSFRDQTGQYKPQANVSSFSTAVTQGATSILMQALSDSDWFLPVEREGLQNILTERKIIRASLQNDKKEGGDVQDLPPLTTSQLLIEGGIISYDSNIKTGGFGAEYFGIGASELYREDLISVYMRAIDVRTGQVLVSVSTSKKILSKEIRAGFFRYVSFKRLAEAEGGYTTNEPMHLCVTQTIEKAITELILKGIDRKVWRAAEPEVAQVTKTIPTTAPIKKPLPKLPNSIYFDYDKTDITKPADKALTSHAKYLIKHPEKKLKLEGHADERGNKQYNVELGKKRAIAAAKTLLTKGVDAQQMMITSLGEAQPAKEGSSEVAYASNRRVELKPVN
ncbi:hypothetical protein GCM10025767_02300 [Thalassotalea piscium]|uniref:Curli production assembly/transport component CsgG n=1 Tax=Thalassotalea piscium TaxID=1230533 RepID=A0A7X0NKG3_9GAMM|nr:curli biogenesis system outer membrane secretion channel CsgG [Thalassotalea piscium]